ncbi:KTSC domain-containing protein [Parapedobacter sp.]
MYPPSVHAGLMGARSKGRYFNRSIVGRFVFKRL